MIQLPKLIVTPEECYKNTTWYLEGDQEDMAVEMPQNFIIDQSFLTVIGGGPFTHDVGLRETMSGSKQYQLSWSLNNEPR